MQSQPSPLAAAASIGGPQAERPASESMRPLSPHPPATAAVVHSIQPLLDPRWAQFVDTHPRSSVFHTIPWIKALHQTYGYEPLAYTTSPPGAELKNGLLLCAVSSWITGRRLVSLPFSDHCEPLLEAADEGAFLSALEETLHREKLRYIELRPMRPLSTLTAPLRTMPAYAYHEIDLRPAIASLFGNCHKSSTQRKILRAEREGLICRTGRSADLFNDFWDLLLMTRRRHCVPPQPRAWFRNLIACFGDALQIRVAYKGGRPLASILTLKYKDAIVYKYGCSDPRFTNLGGTQLLFWKAIEEAKSEERRVFDLGRSDLDNTGLVTFKDRLGAAQTTLTYARFSLAPASESATRRPADLAARVVKGVIPHLPGSLLRVLGSVCYRHFA